MPYYLDRLEYTCAEGRRNEFKMGYFTSEPDGFLSESKRTQLPENLPCSGCKYKLIPASFIRLAHCNLCEADFYKSQEDRYVESAAYNEAGHIVVAAVQQMTLPARNPENLRAPSSPPDCPHPNRSCK